MKVRYQRTPLNIGLVLGACILLLAGGIWYIGQDNASAPHTVDINELVTAKRETTPLATVTARPTQPYAAIQRTGEDIGPGAEWSTYTDSQRGFRMRYPAGWHMPEDSGVLTSYDPGSYLGEKPIPSERIKCDFIPYEEASVQLSGEEVVRSNGIVIVRGLIQAEEGTDGPGLGDAIGFRIEQLGHQSVALICYSYAQRFADELTEMLFTFEFIK